ncbi:MAG: FecR domain-containing protein [Myxococcota bacterium]
MTFETNPTRYSCHECREDAELVMSDRATQGVADLYRAHLKECRDCRKMHRLLYALYEGPVVPPPPTGLAEEKEFHAALRRTREDLPAPWYHKWSLRAGVTAMAGAAAALTLALFGVGPGTFTPVETVADAEQIGAPNSPVEPEAPDAQGGIDHPAQSYGRVLGGDADIVAIARPERSLGHTDTFPVGTRFAVDAHEALQVGMVGKIVANFTPGSDIQWTQATPSLIELEVHRGIAAVRYDRRPSDPILYVRTPTAVVRVIGTVFTVEVDANAETIVSVLRGQVDVLNPETNSLRAEVESGDRYEVATSSHGNVGRAEVAAALPLSNEVDAESSDFTDSIDLADGHIPSSWNVPGLPEDPHQRTLVHVPAPTAEPTTFEMPTTRRRSGSAQVDSYEDEPAPLIIDDEAGDLIERLMEDVKKTRGKELRAALDNCRKLYRSQRTRYRAARCLSNFISQYGDEPAAVEGYLLVGILRMDYALDYRAADNAFEEFLRRAPRNHHSVEMAMYRLWLSATEDGRISEALRRGRRYLDRFPNGKYVGKIFQRFDELKTGGF